MDAVFKGREANLDQEGALALLAGGDIISCQPLPWGSNYAFLVTLADGSGQLRAVYKPQKGEAPLWDFPQGTLYLREYAAYLVSQALGWCFVPPTVIRGGPYGKGSVQLYVQPAPGEDYRSLRLKRTFELQRIAVFDCLTNNADRKGGHCILDRDGRLWAIDHGLTFHVQPKLRTVLWDWSGQTIPSVLVEDLREARPRLDASGDLRRGLWGLLEEAEVEALARRWDGLLRSPIFPLPGPYRSVPWPSV